MMRNRNRRILVRIVGMVGMAMILGSMVSPPAFSIPRVSALKTLPESLTLHDSRDIQHVIVLGKTASGQWMDVTAHAEISCGDSIVAIDENGYIIPRLKGKTVARITMGSLETEIPIAVVSADAVPISFIRDIMPQISKIGCNAGACHGSANGKNGFKLSLRGYDPQYDYQSLIQDISGRRFNRAAPEQSLMLLKPTQEAPHEGGKLIAKDSREYRILLEWIQNGVKSDQSQTDRAKSLDVILPFQILERVGDRQSLIVYANYSDGSKRDVTRDAIIASSVPDVAMAHKDGTIEAVRRGEAAIMVRYEGVFSTHPIIVMGDRSEFVWNDVEEYNYIDRLVYQKLKTMKISPAGLCTDDTFVRRIYLDLTGTTPTPEQIQAFLDDPAPSRTKRGRLADRLLDTDEYIEHWTNKWSDLLQCNETYMGEKGVWVFRNWIRESIASNKPYPQFVQELILASGSSYQNPAANYYRVNNEPGKTVENMTQVFMGVRFQCAKCHDHPFEKWTQNQYYELGAFFGDVGVKPGSLPGEEIVYAKYEETNVLHPKTAKPVSAMVPFGSIDAKRRARVELAEWLTSEDNELFVQSIVNRYWSYFFHRGVIDPVDDIRSSNPPSNPELLEALAADFVQNDFDLKHIMRTICNSRVYQQSIETDRWNEDDTINFSHSIPRRLTAEQLLDAIAVAAGSRSKFEGLPEGFRACQLPDSNLVENDFLTLFGKPERESACECERTSELSLAHAMNLINGKTVSDALNDPKGRIETMIARNESDHDMIDELYLAALSRHPRPDEIATAADYIAKSDNRSEGTQDLLWALMNSPAFLFNR